MSIDATSPWRTHVPLARPIQRISHALDQWPDIDTGIDNVTHALWEPEEGDEPGPGALDDATRAFLGATRGWLYAVYCPHGETLLYIGQTGRLLPERMAEHQAKSEMDARCRDLVRLGMVEVAPYPDAVAAWHTGDYAHVEKALIALLQPPLNRLGIRRKVRR